MAKTITGTLPAQRYTIAGISYNGEGQKCENCNRLIHYVAEVWGRTTNVHHFIGMDCAETLTEARDYQWYQRRWGQVKKAVAALAGHARDLLDADKKEWLDEYGLTLAVAYDARWGSVRLTVPRGYWGTEFTVSIVPSDWHTIYLPVQEKLRALGQSLPEVPADNSTSIWTAKK